MIVTYSSNNSGGYWWLSDDDWRELERCGWMVHWVKDDPYKQEWRPGEDRWLGALAIKATVEAASIEDAIEWWESITDQRADDEGCPCCGVPHSFHEPYAGEDEEYLAWKAAKAIGKEGE
jgi:hypothetical protein